MIKTPNLTTIQDLETASKLLQQKNPEVQNYIAHIDKVTVIFNNKEIGEMNAHTFLFFQNYQNYWLMFKSFENVELKFVLEDLFSKENYLDFQNIDDNNKGLFFSELLNYFNNSLFKDNLYKNYHNLSKNLLSSFAFKEIFQYSKTKFIIPKDYQVIFLEKLSDKAIFQYNWNTFKKVFKAIGADVKDNYFKNHSILEFFSPMLQLAYAYKFKNNEWKHEPSKLIKVVKNDFESFFMSNQTLFEKISPNEQLLLFKIIVHHGRKQLFEYMFFNYEHIRKENYSNNDYSDLLMKAKKSNLDVDLEKYFLYKKINYKLGDKPKEKKLKI